MSCEFEYRENDGETEYLYTCDKEVRGIIRTKAVCTKHFKKLRIDNSRRVSKGLPIPNDTRMVVRDIWIKMNLKKEVSPGPWPELVENEEETDWNEIEVETDED